jgi:4-diphosphocytidyl-2C-methyl-D-erythritol kinase
MTVVLDRERARKPVKTLFGWLVYRRISMPLSLLVARTPVRPSHITAAGLAAGLDNDLQRAALSLRPDLATRLAALRDAGALGAAVSGSGPTCFGLFGDRAAAGRAAAAIPGALAVESR